MASTRVSRCVYRWPGSGPGQPGRPPAASAASPGIRLAAAPDQEPRTGAAAGAVAAPAPPPVPCRPRQASRGCSVFGAVSREVSCHRTGGACHAAQEEISTGRRRRRRRRRGRKVSHCQTPARLAPTAHTSRSRGPNPMRHCFLFTTRPATCAQIWL